MDIKPSLKKFSSAGPVAKEHHPSQCCQQWLLDTWGPVFIMDLPVTVSHNYDVRAACYVLEALWFLHVTFTTILWGGLYEYLHFAQIQTEVWRRYAYRNITQPSSVIGTHDLMCLQARSLSPPLLVPGRCWESLPTTKASNHPGEETAARRSQSTKAFTWLPFPTQPSGVIKHRHLYHAFSTVTSLPPPLTFPSK